MRLTPSGMNRAHHCAWWARSEVSHDPDKPGEHARAGSAFHELAALHLVGAECDVSAVAGKYGVDRVALARRFAGWQASARFPGPVRAEVAFALDTATGLARELPDAAGRSYGGVAEHEICGTADVVWGDGRTVYVVDHKTGDPSNVIPIEENWQLATYAVMAARAYGLDSAVVAVDFVDEDGTVTRAPHELDEFDLADKASRIIEIVQSIPTSEPRPGPWCRYCPALSACPEVREATVDMMPITKRRLPIVIDAAQIEGPEHASYLLGAVRMARDLSGRVEAALQTWADEHGGIAVGNGKVWQRREVQRETIDAGVPGAIDAVRTALGDAAADDALSVTTSKSAIAKAAPSKAAAEKALAGLRAAGAVKTTTTVRYDEVKA